MTKDNSTRKADYLESARIIRDALAGFTQDEQERILRWAAVNLLRYVPSKWPRPPRPARPQM